MEAKALARRVAAKMSGNGSCWAPSSGQGGAIQAAVQVAAIVAVAAVALVVSAT